MIDTVYIDGLEIRKTWGLTPLYEKFYSSVMQFPDVKEKVTNDFEDEDGIEVASTKSYLKSREPVLSLGVDTYEHYLNFMQYLIDHNTFELYSLLINKKITYEYLSHSEFNFYITGSTFAIKLREANFLNRTNIYLLTESGDYLCTEDGNRLII